MKTRIFKIQKRKFIVDNKYSIAFKAATLFAYKCNFNHARRYNKRFLSIVSKQKKGLYLA